MTWVGRLLSEAVQLARFAEATSTPRPARREALVRAQECVAEASALVRDGRPWCDGPTMTPGDRVFWQQKLAEASALTRQAYAAWSAR